ncbi:hypothetical protein [Rathayibacter rathayi]|uniref:hypothetical protein n=1 Tax=Rathayibacter rathayi TaxID=33887 RepID=UPI0011B043A6|nr:hypothetical protein [Rathayibacter rathayi]
MTDPEHPRTPETSSPEEIAPTAQELREDPTFVAEFSTLAEAIDAIVDALGWDPELIPEHDPGRPDPVLEMLYRDVFNVREYPDRVVIYRHHH